MNKISVLIFLVCLSLDFKCQTSDCSGAIKICTNPNFTISPSGAGFVDFTTSSNISNPLSNPIGIVPPAGAGCLFAGELNSTWMIINIQNSGTLEFSMGAGTGPGAQTGCYDWILWPYSGSSTCSQITANTLAPIRCCWNNNCSGGTGLSSAANLPSGAFQDNFGVPINALCGQQFVLCHSNYSNVTTLLPFNFFGTAVVSCSFSPCTGIENSKIQNQQLIIYPNPTNGDFTIVFDRFFENSFIEIYNTVGELVRKQSIIENKTKVSLQAEARGLYNVIVTVEGEQIYKTKVIKE